MERQAWEARRGRAIGETDGERDGQKDREYMGEGGGITCLEQQEKQ